MRSNSPSDCCSRRALGRPATFVAAARADRYSILETEQSAEKKFDEFYAKVFGISLTAVFVIILIFDAASSSTPTYRDHRAEFAGIRADLPPFAQAWSGPAATDEAYGHPEADTSTESARQRGLGEERGNQSSQKPTQRRTSCATAVLQEHLLVIC